MRPGLCARLIAEGYTGYLIRTTNDEKSGGRSMAQNILSNEQEHLKMAAALGFKDVFDLYYRNHRMDGIAAVEIQSRLATSVPDAEGGYCHFIQSVPRTMKIRTTRSRPRGGGGRADGGQDNDFHEHFEAGFRPHAVPERYYFQRPAGAAVQPVGG